MRIRAAFIGVDRHSDAGIRDLSGCRRDARALHALFTDTFDGLTPILLLDQDATVAAVRHSFQSVLEDAEPDDVAIVSFSGHGTRDHRLVLHDTSKSDLPVSTIDMAELAEHFKRSKARVILCILDCCFSGGAPARVLEDSPAPRSPGSPLESIAGEGRLIMAASNVNEPALELGGHGLLTKALIDVLQDGTDTVSVVAAVDCVMARVRADASRLGAVQTPVLFGHVEGGLVIPVLKKGANWSAAFPGESRHDISGDLDELISFGLPAALISAWKKYVPKLNDLQLQAINEHGLLEGRSLLVVAPTSSGKTFVGELAAATAITARRRAVFLFPYKALTNEKYDQFRETYGGLGYRVIRCTSDAHDEVGEFLRGKYDLALFTYEMFLSVALSSPWTLELLGLVVVDEAQFLAEPRRGIVVELILTLLLRAREKGISPQLVALSAVIGDVNSLDSWLGADALVTTDRPVPLIEGVLDRGGCYRFRDVDGVVRQEQLVSYNAVVQRRDKPSAQDVIVPLVLKLLSERADERVIIFRNARGPAEGCAAYLARDLHLGAAEAGILQALPTDDPSSSSRALRECLLGGTAFHNANLGPVERQVVERVFREREGSVRVLAATTTVAAGINTPASTVILAEQEFFGEDGRPFTVAEYKNMAGRAGRLGYNERGRAIILADDGVSPEFLLHKYVLADPETLQSSFSPDELETWVLRLLAQVTEVRCDEVAGLLANTFGGYLAARADPGWHGRTQTLLETLLAEMLQLGLVEEERGIIRLTLLGQVCGRSSLSFTSAMRLVRMLKAESGTTTAERLMLLIQALPECDATYTPLMKRGTAEDKWAGEVARHCGRDAAYALQTQSDQNTYRARCKRVMVLHDWIRGVPMESIETTATTNPYQGKIAAGHVRQFADTARFHLRAAFEIANVVLLDRGPSGEEVELLLYQLEFGVPANVVDVLRDLPLPLQRGDSLALAGAGIDSIAKLWTLAITDLTRILGRDCAKRIEPLRPSVSACF